MADRTVGWSRMERSEGGKERWLEEDQFWQENVLRFDKISGFFGENGKT